MENQEQRIVVIGSGRTIGKTAYAMHLASMAQVVHELADNCNDKLERIHEQNGEIPRRMSDFVLNDRYLPDSYFTPPLTRKERRAIERKNKKR